MYVSFDNLRLRKRVSAGIGGELSGARPSDVAAGPALPICIPFTALSPARRMCDATIMRDSLQEIMQASDGVMD
jgi:hypothetical protein